jgi:hypothetical protein
MTASAKIQEPSMEEILASIRRIIADDQDGPRAQPVVAPPAPPPAAVNDVLDLADLQPSPTQPKLELDHEDVSFRDADGQVDFDSIAVEDEPPPPPPPAPTPLPLRAQAAAPPPGPSETLLSNTTGASVAGAFQMLSATVLSSQARTLEDLVQDMLRPMLKSWLDENLPGMVERLVRAEIERVTRGGR